MLPRCFCFCGVFFLLVVSSANAEDRAKVFRAGAHAQDITPTKFPVSVNGGFQDRQAKAAHDPLHARCLVLDDGTTKIAIAVCDSCAIPREIMDEAKRLASKATGIPTDRMLISATHTHEAPTVAGASRANPMPTIRSTSVSGSRRGSSRRTPTSCRRGSAGALARTRRRSSTAAGR